MVLIKLHVSRARAVRIRDGLFVCGTLPSCLLPSSSFLLRPFFFVLPSSSFVPRPSSLATCYDQAVMPVRLHKTIGVKVGDVQVGGGAPVVVQSMTMTDTADAAATARQVVELWEAGSEMVRVTVNVPDAAAAVPEIKQR